MHVRVVASTSRAGGLCFRSPPCASEGQQLTTGRRSTGLLSLRCHPHHLALSRLVSAALTESRGAGRRRGKEKRVTPRPGGCLPLRPETHESPQEVGHGG